MYIVDTRKDELFEKCPPSKYFAIINYVPDFYAEKIVRNTFPNVFSYYPRTSEER